MGTIKVIPFNPNQERADIARMFRCIATAIESGDVVVDRMDTARAEHVPFTIAINLSAQCTVESMRPEPSSGAVTTIAEMEAKAKARQQWRADQLHGNYLANSTRPDYELLRQQTLARVEAANYTNLLWDMRQTVGYLEDITGRRSNG